MTPESIITNVLLGAGGLTGAGILLRMIWTWANRQGMITQGDSSQKELIASLTEEAERWRQLHADAVKAHEDAKRQHEATLILLGETRLQNRMLRMLLIQRGMTPEELDAALELSQSNTHQ